MSGRTFAIGDIHGDLEQLIDLLKRMGPIGRGDKIVLLGDYLDRGPRSPGHRVHPVRAAEDGRRDRAAPRQPRDAWLRVIDDGWDGFVLPPGNGCLSCVRSFTGGPPATLLDQPRDDAEWEQLLTGSFFDDATVDWMRRLPHWHEDDNALYVHAGLPRVNGRFLHPSLVDNPAILLWTRTLDFFKEYDGKTAIVGHTVTSLLPPGCRGTPPRIPTTCGPATG
ncbi:MAG: metallophosphoesterase [Myxococcota bacterium]